ncbi:glutamate racemase [Indioceanicola profundi]|uniref:glutamate racemase n=1 Tax=Indioceanicola profundi TaxID=2220096 RepID=UPI000E6A9B78|nr:glutamate racemase [Indioceanicola profundi]
MIGVFDSGHGGLTVLRALHAGLPDKDFTYLGDHAAAPYGNRTPEEVYQLTLAGVERLFALGCPLVVLACNTASAIALRRLQQSWLPHAHPDKRVLGVLVPMVEAITGQPWMADVPAGSMAGEPRTIGIFATRGTVESEAYPREIGKRAPEVRVVQQACPDLVRLIEQDAPAGEIRAAVQTYADALMAKMDGVPPQAVMLGCTHYPLVSDAFVDALPAGVEVLCQPTLTTRSLGHYLERHPEFDLPGTGRVTFHTTGDAERVTRLATRFFGRPAQFRTLTTAGEKVAAS